MQLTPADIKRLYGSQFWILPESGLAVAPAPMTKEEAAAVAPEPKPEPAPQPAAEPATPPAPSYPFLEIGATATWKMKAKATLALILHKDEYLNRNLTQRLQQAVVAAGIDTSLIGFGILEGEGPTWNLLDMPVNTGVLFHDLDGRFKGVVEHKHKCFIHSPALADLAAEPDLTPKLRQALREAQSRL
jgi:hypothetical protein